MISQEGVTGVVGVVKISLLITIEPDAVSCIRDIVLWVFHDGRCKHFLTFDEHRRFDPKP